MSLVIAFGIQKGGCSKTTTTGIVAHKLSSLGKKVLAVDMDCQGNLTELLSNLTSSEFADRSILEAIKANDAETYIYKVNDKVDLLPANNLLAILPRYLYQTYGFSTNKIYEFLKQLLEPIKNNYDYILIDTPPALSEHTVGSFVASDYVVVMFESSQWCYSAIPNFLDSVNLAKKLNNSLKIAGILRTLNDVRRNDAKAFNDLIGAKYTELVFDTVIKRKAATGRLAISGFEKNDELKDAIDQYQSFFEELIKRVG